MVSVKEIIPKWPAFGNAGEQRIPFWTEGVITNKQLSILKNYVQASW